MATTELIATTKHIDPSEQFVLAARIDPAVRIALLSDYPTQHRIHTLHGYIHTNIRHNQQKAGKKRTDYDSFFSIINN